MASVLSKKIKSLDEFEDEFDAIVMIEMNKGTLNALKSVGVAHKIINLIATPFEAGARPVLGTYSSMIEIKKAGGRNVVPTQAFLELESLYKTQKKDFNKDVLDWDYWAQNDIFSGFYPPISISSHEIVAPSTDVGTGVVSAQRFDAQCRRGHTLGILSHKHRCYSPSRWNPPAKYNFILDEDYPVIQEAIRSAKAVINTCDKTGTVENFSAEATSMGVQIIQVLMCDDNFKEGYPHATFEYQPDAIKVLINPSMSHQQVADKVQEAIESIDDSLVQRKARAQYLYEKYSDAAAKATWDALLA